MGTLEEAKVKISEILVEYGVLNFEIFKICYEFSKLDSNYDGKIQIVEGYSYLMYNKGYVAEKAKNEVDKVISYYGVLTIDSFIKINNDKNENKKKLLKIEKALKELLKETESEEKLSEAKKKVRIRFNKNRKST